MPWTWLCSVGSREILRKVAQVVHFLGLGGVAYRGLAVARQLRRPGSLVRNWKARSEGLPDGLPIPPDNLLYLVGGAVSVSGYYRTGQKAREGIERILGKAGLEVEDFGDVLDFGCGCGRLLRQWEDIETKRLHGCDYNPKLVRWCQENLPYSVSMNGLHPPLNYEDESFDFVYALSVFTHLTGPSQLAWVEELRRVLRPGGVLMVSLMGESHAERLLRPEEAERFRSGDMVVTTEAMEGTNVCAAFHPPEYVEEGRFAEGFEVLAVDLGGALGNGRQDQWLFRKG